MSFANAQIKANRSKRAKSIRIKGGSDKSRAEEHLMAKLREAQKENGELLKEIRDKELAIETLEAQLHESGQLEVDKVLSTRTRFGSVQYKVVWKGTKWEKKEVLLELGYEDMLAEFDHKKQEIQEGFLRDPEQYMRLDSDFQRIVQTLKNLGSSKSLNLGSPEKSLPMKNSHQNKDKGAAVAVIEEEKKSEEKANVSTDSSDNIDFNGSGVIIMKKDHIQNVTDVTERSTEK